MKGFVENMKKVSIITPCYNSEKTIRRTIESVLYQSYVDIEYIIIDGNSTDNTVEIIKEYIPLFKGRLIYVSEKDKGIYDAMNKGIRMATGQIIGIINSDDYYELDTVQKVIDNMKDVPYQVIYGYCNYINKRGITKILKESHKELDRKMIPHPTCFITREVYYKYGMFLDKMKIAADYELLLRLSKKKDIHFIQIKNIIANFYEGGISSARNMRKKIIQEQAISKYRHKVIDIKEFIKIYIGSFCKDQSELADKHFRMFMLMEQWVRLKQEGKNLSVYMKQRKYYNVAIYGMSYIGVRLLKELEDSGVNVKYGIDKNPESVDVDIKVFSSNDELEEVDAIIVTSTYYFDEIELNLKRKTKCTIISLEDIIYGI